MDALARRAPALDFVWHLGDIAYADDTYLHDPVAFLYEDAYDEYMAEASAAFAASTPYMTLPGNHEGERVRRRGPSFFVFAGTPSLFFRCHSPACVANWHRGVALNNFSAYNARFRMPSAESGGSASMYYSFDHGPLHVVALNTETDYAGAPGDSYYPFLGTGGFCDAERCGDWTAWLESDLKRVDRSKTPWVVVGGHRPVYSIKGVDPDSFQPVDDCADLHAAVARLFETYGVDLYLAAHEHAYERAHAINGTTYVLTGCAGNDEGHSDYSEAVVDAPWSAFWNNTVFGHGELAVANATHMTWTQFDDATGAALDTVVITRPPVAAA